MKKFLLLAAASAVVFSCKPTFDTSAQSNLKGNWTISETKVTGTTEWIEVTSFDDAKLKCFKGSKWFFVANNQTGNYTLTGSPAGCPSGTTQIKWYVTPAGVFGFKKVFTGEKAKNVTQGYELQIQNMTATSFDLVDQESVGGQPINITYHFVKSS